MAATAKHSALPSKDFYDPPTIVCKSAESLGSAQDKQRLAALAAEGLPLGITASAKHDVFSASREVIHQQDASMLLEAAGGRRNDQVGLHMVQSFID